MPTIYSFEEYEFTKNLENKGDKAWVLRSC
jgi:hypothetical protein